jgi:hypothetical protein
MTREYGLLAMVNCLLDKIDQFRSSENEHERALIKEKIPRVLAAYTEQIKSKEVSNGDTEDPTIDVLTELREGLKGLSISETLQDEFFDCFVGADERSRYFTES